MGNFISDAWDDITGKSNTNAMIASNNAATAAQQGFEKQKWDRMTGLQDQQLQQAGELKQQTQGPANEWTTNYLDWLKNSPDTAYNASKTAMERGYNTSMDQAAKQANAMGRSGGGMLQSMFNNLAYNRATGLGQLENQRVQSQGQKLGTGTQLVQSLYDRALNLATSASGMQIPQSTQVPQMMQQGIGSPQVQNIMGKAGQQDMSGAGNKIAQPLRPMVG